MNIFVYLRPWNKEFYCKLLSSSFPGSEIVKYSDYKGIGDYWTGDYLYSDSSCPEDGFFDESKEEIITRCRYLRGLPRNKAEMMAAKVWKGINGIFNEGQIDLVVIPLIDNYIMDIIERIAHKRAIPVLSMVQNFIKGYSRFSVRGERIDLNRVIENSEIENVYQLLVAENYKPDFSLMKEKSYFDMAKGYYRRKLIEKIYYPIHMILENDRLNYMYNYSMFNGKSKEYIGKQIYSYYTKIQDLKIQDNSFYMPLHYSPESTVDYWSTNYKDALYESSVLKFIERINGRYPIILKEHPSMVGWRNRNFYEKVLSFSNVCIVHPYESSNLLLEKVDNVVVYTGSVGVEALLRGKKVLALTTNYYSDIHPNIKVVNSFDEHVLDDEIEQYDGREFIHSLLKGLFKYRFGDGRHMEEQTKTYHDLIPWIHMWWNSIDNRGNNAKET